MDNLHTPAAGFVSKHRSCYAYRMKIFSTLILSVTFALTVSTHSFANDTPALGNNANDLTALQVSKTGDLNLSCNALSKEAGSMSQIIHTTQDIKNSSEMKSHGVTAAGAVGSFLIGSVTGGIGLAVGGFLMNHNIEEHSDQADKTQDFAEQRRTLMMGIHNAKGCYGPIEHAMQNPAEFDPIDKIALNTESKHQSKLRTRYND